MIPNKKKVFYWAPCLNKVGTVISTKNSAISLARYKRTLYDVYILNVCGEWNEYIQELKKFNVKVINLSFNYYKYLPKNGYISSRFSYILIFLLTLIPLFLCLKKNKADYFIMHLITSLPLFLIRTFKFKTKFILRISGYPKLNFFRKILWKKSNEKLFKITCPTQELLSKLKKEKIFSNNKIFYLQDAIINLNEFKNKKNLQLNFKSDKKIILSVGRLTKQKNYQYLINEYKKFLQYSDEYDLVILGDGEEKFKLIELSKMLDIEKRVHFKGRVNNVYDYMKKSKILILSSLWEELGFVLVEAAFNNLFIISSNCPNGPTEFINQDRCGILFESNKINSLTYALNKYLKLDNIHKIKLSAKKKSNHYTKFRHHLALNEILNNENKI